MAFFSLVAAHYPMKLCLSFRFTNTGTCVCVLTIWSKWNTLLESFIKHQLRDFKFLLQNISGMKIRSTWLVRKLPALLCFKMIRNIREFLTPRSHLWPTVPWYCLQGLVIHLWYFRQGHLFFKHPLKMPWFEPWALNARHVLCQLASSLNTALNITGFMPSPVQLLRETTCCFFLGY